VGLFLVLGLAGSVSATLIAHWKLDDAAGSTAHDSTGNGYDGTLVGGTTWVIGAIDGALEVDGSSGYVDLGSPAGWPAGTSPRSLCGWGRTDTTASGYRWLASYGTAGTGQAMFIGLNGSSLIGGGFNGDDVTVAGAWKVGEWRHAALTYDGSTAKVYVNGVLAASTAKSWNLVLNRAYLGEQINSAREYWNGAIDDVRLYDTALSAAEVKALVPAKLKAYNPIPADGAAGVTSSLLKWTAGDTAKWHDVYLGTSPDLTEADRKANHLPRATALYYHMAGFESGVTYYWRVDEIESDDAAIHTGDVWSFTTAPVKAFHPIPADGARFQPLDVAVSWTAGDGALSHDVYWGTDEAAVAAGTAGTFRINQTTTTYQPAALTPGTLYFWRIDEVKAGGVKVQGSVWSFRTVPDIAVSDPNLVGWWTFDEGEGTLAIDWSGHGVHGDLYGDTAWIEGQVGGALEFDGDGDYIDLGNPNEWPDGAEPRSMCAWARTLDVGSSWRWIAAYGSPNTSQAMFIGLNGATLYGGGYGNDLSVSGFWEVGVWHHIALTYDGSTARLYADGVELTSGARTWNLVRSRARIGQQVNSYFEYWYGAIDDVRVYKVALAPEQVVDTMRGNPALAWNPLPATGANVDIGSAAELSWSAGDTAAEHDVYFGTDRQAIKAADTTSPLYQGRQAGTTFSAEGMVEFGGGSCFWRIDEVEADGVTVHTGIVWTFTVPDYLLIDEFETYTDLAGNTIYESWIDDFSVGASGSMVGHFDPPFAEQTIVHGGEQSMPFYYDNSKSPYYSEAEHTFTPVQNWTDHNVDTLSLWFRGNPAAYVETGTDAFRISAAGTDIGGAADQCRFAYKTLTGNGSITAKVESLAMTNGAAKAGVMIRQTLDADSKNAAMVVTPSSGAAASCRMYTGDITIQVNAGGITAPYWVRLTRTGDVFKAEHSANGATWTVLAEQYISMLTTLYVGLCVTSHDATTPTVAEFSNVTTAGTVTGSWQVAEIGADHPGNDADDLYVAIEDSAGKKAIVVHEDPEAVLATEWTQWSIPLSRFTGVSLSKVKKMYLGVGDSKNPAQDGSGLIYIDDIHVTRP
jgi:regulation of enolase protein 1 (concanavalin A-like superfamily)